MKLIAILLAPVFLVGCATCRVGSGSIEQCKTQAGGFYEAIHAVEGDFGFEGVGHFNHCHYRKRDFGQCSTMSVSPSGNAAVWQQSSTGSVVYFAKGMAGPVVLLPQFPQPSSLERVVWDEPAGTITVKAWQQSELRTLEIPAGG